MPRKKRAESPTGVYHWIVRGMNKKDLFHEPKDYWRFRELIIEHKAAYAISVYHYCFMTNHAHMLLRSETLEALSGFSHYLQRRYAYYYCGQYQWTGSVFQRGYRSFPVDRDEYLLECGRYIERNPLKARLVERPDDYKHSSYHYYAKGKEDDLVSPSPAYLGLSPNPLERRKIYEKYVREYRIQEEMLEKGLLLV